MSDYIDPKDEGFDLFLRGKFAPFININFAALGLTAAENTALQNATIMWGYSWVAYGNADTAMKAATSDKNTKRDTVEALVRQLAQKVQVNPAVTDVQKIDMGLHIYKTTKTPVNAPTTAPILTRADVSTRCILRLFYADTTTPAIKAKPAGVQACEIREQIGGTAPTDPEKMAFLAIETRTPYRADYEADDAGKTVYLAFRWLSTRGEPGPWSKIYSAVVPV